MSILRLSGVNLHITESKKFMLKFFTSEQRTKSLIVTDEIMPQFNLHYT